jgi:hypothetical protein
VRAYQVERLVCLLFLHRLFWRCKFHSSTAMHGIRELRLAGALPLQLDIRQPSLCLPLPFLLLRVREPEKQC